MEIKVISVTISINITVDRSYIVNKGVEVMAKALTKEALTFYQ